MASNFRDALASVMELVEDANKYYDTKQPWVLKKQEDQTDFNNCIYTCVQIIANLSILLEPFMPFSAKKIRDYLGINQVKWQRVEVECGKQFGTIEPLFTRLTDSDVL